MSMAWRQLDADLKELAQLEWAGFLARFQAAQPVLVLGALGDSGYTAVNCLAPAGYAFAHNQPLPHRSTGPWHGTGYAQLLDIEKTMTALLKKNRVKKARFGVTFLGLAGLSGFATERPSGYAGLFEHRAILVRNDLLPSLREGLQHWLAQLGDLALCPLPAGLAASDWHARYLAYPVPDCDAFRADSHRLGRYLFDHRLPFLNASMIFQPAQLSLQEGCDYLEELHTALRRELDHLERHGEPLVLDLGADARVIPYYYGSGAVFLPHLLLQDLLFLVKADDRTALSLKREQIADICRLRATIVHRSGALCFLPMMDIACSQLRDYLQRAQTDGAFARADIEAILALCEDYVAERYAQYPALAALRA